MGMTPLLEAISQSGPRCIDAYVKLLLDNGADVNTASEAKFSPGWTPLYCAVKLSKKSIVEQLLKIEGIDVNKPDAFGNTPLHAAVAQFEPFISNIEPVAKLLEIKGIDVNIANSIRITALHIAAANGHKDLVELLLDSGADVNQKNNKGQTSLHIAAASGNQNLVEWLLNIGADVNQKNNIGQTSLHIAVASGNQDLVEWLLNRGADISQVDNEGRTSLHIAAQVGNKDLVILLLARGVYISQVDEDGLTPLAIAEQSGHNAIKNLFTIIESLDENVICGISLENLSINGTFAQEHAYSTGGKHLYQESLIRMHLNNNNGSAQDPTTREQYSFEDLIDLSVVIQNHFAARLEKVKEKISQLSDENRSSVLNNNREISSYTIEEFAQLESNVQRYFPSQEEKGEEISKNSSTLSKTTFPALRSQSPQKKLEEDDSSIEEKKGSVDKGNNSFASFIEGSRNNNPDKDRGLGV